MNTLKTHLMKQEQTIAGLQALESEREEKQKQLIGMENSDSIHVLLHEENRSI